MHENKTKYHMYYFYNKVNQNNFRATGYVYGKIYYTLAIPLLYELFFELLIRKDLKTKYERKKSV